MSTGGSRLTGCATRRDQPWHDGGVSRRARPLDLAVGPLLILFGIIALAALGGVIAIEAFLLAAVRWGPSMRCLVDSALANVVSTAIGLLAYLWLGDEPGYWMTLVAWLVMLALTIAIEAVVLHLRRPPGAPLALRVAVVINVPTYVLLFALTRFLP